MSGTAVGAILGIGVLALLGLYFVGMAAVAERLSPARQRAALGGFAAGLTVTAFAFIPSPLLPGPDLQFTVNMVQFIALTALAPPLL